MSAPPPGVDGTITLMVFGVSARAPGQGMAQHTVAATRGKKIVRKQEPMMIPCLISTASSARNSADTASTQRRLRHLAAADEVASSDGY
jgi:hypothetical protein